MTRSSTLLLAVLLLVASCRSHSAGEWSHAASYDNDLVIPDPAGWIVRKLPTGFVKVKVGEESAKLETYYLEWSNDSDRGFTLRPDQFILTAFNDSSDITSIPPLSQEEIDSILSPSRWLYVVIAVGIVAIILYPHLTGTGLGMPTYGLSFIGSFQTRLTPTYIPPGQTLQAHLTFPIQQDLRTRTLYYNGVNETVPFSFVRSSP